MGRENYAQNIEAEMRKEMSYSRWEYERGRRNYG